MTKIICGWCGEEFKENILKNKDGERNVLICPNCNRLLPSSKKESTKNLVGRKHIHVEYKDGDVV